MGFYRGSETPSAGTAPTGEASKISVDDTAGNYSGTTVEAVLAEIGADAYHVELTCFNNTGGTLSGGTVVYISGFNTANSLPEVTKADADTASAMPAIGMVNSDGISTGASGNVVVFGVITGIDTSSYSVADALYVSTTAGAVTATRPTGATDSIQIIGEVEEVGTSGKIFIAGAYRSNALPNLTTNKYWEGDGSNQPAEIGADDIKANMSLTNGKIIYGASSVFTEKDPEQVVTQTIVCNVVDFGDSVTAADGQFFFVVPDSLNGCDLTNVNAAVAANTFSSGTYAIDIYNVTQAADMLSTAMTIDAGETSTTSAATPAVIDAANDDVATDDIIRIDVTTIGGGGSSQGLWITLEFLKP